MSKKNPYLESIKAKDAGLVEKAERWHRAERKAFIKEAAQKMHPDDPAAAEDREQWLERFKATKPERNISADVYPSTELMDAVKIIAPIILRQPRLVRAYLAFDIATNMLNTAISREDATQEIPPKDQYRAYLSLWRIGVQICIAYEHSHKLSALFYMNEARAKEHRLNSRLQVLEEAFSGEHWIVPNRYAFLTDELSGRYPASTAEKYRRAAEAISSHRQT